MPAVDALKSAAKFLAIPNFTSACTYHLKFLNQHQTFALTGGGINFDVAKMIIASLFFNVILLIFLASSRRTARRQRSDLKVSSIELDDAGNRLVLALEGADLGFWEWDIINDNIHLNLRGLEILGYRKDQFGAKMNHWVQLVHPDDVDVRRGAMHHHLSGETERYECEYRIRHKEGHWVWVLDRARIFSRRADGTPSSMVGTFLDISARKKMERELIVMAATDPLTGLHNRRVFMERLRQEWSHKKRRPSLDTSVIMCDIDYFKRINDSFGHAAGDHVLIQLAALLNQQMRDNDLAARLGGEEFAVILQDMSVPDALKWAERVRSAVEGAVVFDKNGSEIRFSISMGVSEILGSDSDFDVSLTRADQALYCAKNEGRNKVVTLR